MKNVPIWFALIGIGILMSACAKSDFDVKVTQPDVPANSVASVPNPRVTNVSVVGAEKMNFVVKPLTTICFPVNFKVTYAEAVTKSIKETIAHVAIETSGKTRTFTVTIADFNARVMSMLVDPFVFRHDAEVRVKLHSREDVAGGRAIKKEGEASVYYESPRDDSGFCDKGQDALAYALHKAMSAALADLASAINVSGQENPLSAPKQSDPSS